MWLETLIIWQVNIFYEDSSRDSDNWTIPLDTNGYCFSYYPGYDGRFARIYRIGWIKILISGKQSTMLRSHLITHIANACDLCLQSSDHSSPHYIRIVWTETWQTYNEWLNTSCYRMWLESSIIWQQQSVLYPYYMNRNMANIQWMTKTPVATVCDLCFQSSDHSSPCYIRIIWTETWQTYNELLKHQLLPYVTCIFNHQTTAVHIITVLYEQKLGKHTMND